jgi:hypothetical protein
MANKTSVDYLSTYEGKLLLEKHSLHDIGIWQVLGENMNDSPHSCGYSPTLGFFEGMLTDVIEHAVTLDKFWGYGAGGRFEKIGIKRITPETTKRRQAMTAQLNHLKSEADKLEKELNRL